MRLIIRCGLALALLGGSLVTVPSPAQTIVTVGSGFASPVGVAVDGAGNVFVADQGNNAVKEVVAADFYTATTVLATGFNQPAGVAVDGSGNVFVADTINSAVKEIPAGSSMVTTLASGYGRPNAVALDRNGNAFFLDGRAGKAFEALAAGGYTTVLTIGSGMSNPSGIVVDAGGNVFVTDMGNGVVREILAAGGYTTMQTVGSGFKAPYGIAIDGTGNLFVADPGIGVLEIPAAGGYATVETIYINLPHVLGIAVDASENLYISDGQGLGTITELFAAGNYSSTRFLGSFTGNDGVVIDGAGNLFVADFYGVHELLAAGGYATTKTLAAGYFVRPQGLALDADGDLFVADVLQGGLREILAAGGYVTVEAFLSNLISDPGGVAVDASGNVFVADTGDNAIKEFLAADGYATVKTLGSGFDQPTGIAVDAAGNVFVADTGSGLLKEILASSGYATVQTVLPGMIDPTGIAVDRNGNLYLLSLLGNGLEEILAVAGSIPPSPTILSLGSGLSLASGVAVDGSGNVFVADTGNNAVKEILAVSPPLLAAVLPSARALQVGNPATVLATMINSGTAALGTCQPALPPAAPAGLSLSYQTTDPTSNVPTGTPDTPVTIAGNDGSQSFVLAFQGTQPFSAPAMPIIFSCAGAAPATVIPGVDTIDLTFSPTPTADIILAEQTPSNDGILTIPSGNLANGNGLGAFAVASLNHGVAETLTVSVDTGAADLATIPHIDICQTVASTGQCVNPEAPSLTLDFAAGEIDTFSVFVEAFGPVDFAPASSRVFVRFKDQNGVSHGSVSVAVRSDERRTSGTNSRPRS